MKKIYNSPNVEYTTVIHCGIICGLSGTNDSGLGQQEDPNKGENTSSGWGMPRKRVF